MHAFPHEELPARWAAAIEPVDGAAAAAARLHWDQLTKPRGSLGLLEELAARLAAMARTPTPAAGPAAVLVFAGDHGVAAEGVSAYPQAVTVQMLANIRRGGAAVNVLARQAGTRLMVTDVGSLAGPEGEEADLPALAPEGAPVRVRRVRRGTGSIAAGPAMSPAEALAALNVGFAAAVQAAGGVAAQAGGAVHPDGAVASAGAAAASGLGRLPLLAIGELGIGNTTVAAALTAAFLDVDPGLVVGPGTGLSTGEREHKVAVVRRALAVNRSLLRSPLAALAALGGLEFAAMAGAVLGAAASRAAVVLDGVSATAAALAAVRLVPAVAGYLVAATRSPEPGHPLLLDALGLEPVLKLGLRLGETSGAALALPLIRSTLALGAEMATFARAGVAGRALANGDPLAAAGPARGQDQGGENAAAEERATDGD